MPGFRLDGPSLHELFEAEQVNVTLGVPTIWLGLLNYLRESGKKLPDGLQLVCGGAAAGWRSTSATRVAGLTAA